MADPGISPTIIVRGEGNSDAEAVKAVVEEAFADERLRKFIWNLRKSAYFKPELSCVADRARDILGYVLYFPVIVQGQGQAYKAVHMSPIAVRAVPERQGVGERLVRHGIQRAHSLGYEIVLVMGPAPYFSYFGFQRASALGFEAQLPVADENFLVHLMRPELAGAAKGRVLYPPGIFAV